MAAPPQRKAFPLRLDPALFAAIERTAASDLRSINAQLECLLREALARRGVRLAPVAPVRRGRPPAGAVTSSAGEAPFRDRAEEP